MDAMFIRCTQLMVAILLAVKVETRSIGHQYIPSPSTWEDAHHYCQNQFNGSIYNFKDSQETALAKLPKNGTFWKGDFTILSAWMVNIGCYSRLGHLVLERTQLLENSPGVCQIHCNTSIYFALQGKICICLGNEIPRTFKPSLDISCDIRCQNHSQSFELCGGTTKYSIYEKETFKNDSTKIGNNCVAVKCISHHGFNSLQYYGRNCSETYRPICRMVNGTKLLVFGEDYASNWTEGAKSCFVKNNTTMTAKMDLQCPYNFDPLFRNFFWVGIYRQLVTINEHVGSFPRKNQICTAITKMPNSQIYSAIHNCSDALPFICQFPIGSHMTTQATQNQPNSASPMSTKSTSISTTETSYILATTEKESTIYDIVTHNLSTSHSGFTSPTSLPTSPLLKQPTSESSTQIHNYGQSSERYITSPEEISTDHGSTRNPNLEITSSGSTSHAGIFTTVVTHAITTEHNANPSTQEAETSKISPKSPTKTLTMTNRNTKSSIKTISTAKPSIKSPKQTVTTTKLSTNSPKQTVTTANRSTKSSAQTVSTAKLSTKSPKQTVTTTKLSTKSSTQTVTTAKFSTKSSTQTVTTAKLSTKSSTQTVTTAKLSTKSATQTVSTAKLSTELPIVPTSKLSTMSPTQATVTTKLSTKSYSPTPATTKLSTAYITPRATPNALSSTVPKNYISTTFSSNKPTTVVPVTRMQDKKAALPIGPVAGGSGGFVLVILILVIICIRKKKRINYAKTRGGPNIINENGTIQRVNPIYDISDSCVEEPPMKDSSHIYSAPVKHNTGHRGSSLNNMYLTPTNGDSAAKVINPVFSNDTYQSEGVAEFSNPYVDNEEDDFDQNKEVIKAQPKPLTHYPDAYQGVSHV